MNEWKDKFRKHIPRFIRNDFPRKVFAFFLSLLLVLMIRSNLDNTGKRAISGVKVHFQLPENYQFQTKMEPEVYLTIQVEGNESLVEKLRPESFEIIKKVTPSEAKEGTVTFTAEDIKYKGSRLFNQLEIKDFSPEKCKLELDHYIVRHDIPIEVTYDKNELPEGYTLLEVVLPQDQKTVSVRGPSRIVSSLKRISTERIPLVKATQGFNNTVRLKSPDADVTLASDKLMVEVKIAGRINQEISAVPVQARFSLPGTAGMSCTVEPSAVKIYYEEPRRFSPLERAVKADFHPSVDISSIQGIAQCKVDCWTDRSDVRILRIEPETVTVTVTAKPETEPK